MYDQQPDPGGLPARHEGNRPANNARLSTPGALGAGAMPGGDEACDFLGLDEEFGGTGGGGGATFELEPPAATPAQAGQEEIWEEIDYEDDGEVVSLLDDDGLDGAAQQGAYAQSGHAQTGYAQDGYEEQGYDEPALDQHGYDESGELPAEDELYEEEPQEGVLAAWKEDEPRRGSTRKLVLLGLGVAIVGMTGAAAFKLINASKGVTDLTPEPLAAHSNPLIGADRMQRPDTPAQGAVEPERLALGADGQATPTPARTSFVPPSADPAEAARQAFESSRGDRPPSGFDATLDTPVAPAATRNQPEPEAESGPPVFPGMTSQNTPAEASGADAGALAQGGEPVSADPTPDAVELVADAPVADPIEAPVVAASDATPAESTSAPELVAEVASEPASEPVGELVAPVSAPTTELVAEASGEVPELVAESTTPSEPVGLESTAGPELVAEGSTPDAEPAGESSSEVASADPARADETVVAATSEPAPLELVPADEPVSQAASSQSPASQGPASQGDAQPAQRKLPWFDVALLRGMSPPSGGMAGGPGAPPSVVDAQAPRADAGASTASILSIPTVAATTPPAAASGADTTPTPAGGKPLEDFLAGRDPRPVAVVPSESPVPGPPSGNLRQASTSDLKGVWQASKLPERELLSRPSRILTPNVGRVRIVLGGKDVFEGRLYAVGEGNAWIETAHGRMALEGARISSMDQLDSPDGTPALGEPGSQDLAGMERVRVKTPGGTFYGKVIARDDKQTTVVTDDGARLTLDSKLVELLVDAPKVTIKGTVPGDAAKKKTP